MTADSHQNTEHAKDLCHQLWLIYTQLKDAEGNPDQRLELLEQSRLELGTVLNEIYRLLLPIPKSLRSQAANLNCRDRQFNLTPDTTSLSTFMLDSVIFLLYPFRQIISIRKRQIFMVDHRMAKLISTLFDFSVISQNAIHSADRTMVSLLVEQCRIDFSWCLVHEALLVKYIKDFLSLRIAQGSWRLRSLGLWFLGCRLDYSIIGGFRHAYCHARLPWLAQVSSNEVSYSCC